MPQDVQSPNRRRSTTAPKASARATPKRSADARGTARKRSTGKHVAAPDDAARREMIAVAAYFLAERRGFSTGNPLDDWVQAEAEIAQLYPG